MLSRDKQPMADFIKNALLGHKAMFDNKKRPDYQTNDYLSWIYSAKFEKTRQKRLNQMIDELKKGGVYMNMKHPSSQKDSN